MIGLLGCGEPFLGPNLNGKRKDHHRFSGSLDSKVAAFVTHSCCFFWVQCMEKAFATGDPGILLKGNLGSRPFWRSPMLRQTLSPFLRHRPPGVVHPGLGLRAASQGPHAAAAAAAAAPRLGGGAGRRPNSSTTRRLDDSWGESSELVTRRHEVSWLW